MIVLNKSFDETNQVYTRQLQTAMKIVPDLSTFLYVVPNWQNKADENENMENVNFYHRFNADLLMYKIVRWFGAGARTCYTGRNDTFKLYPEIGVLTALNIAKIDALKLEDVATEQHYIDSHVRKLILKIDVLFGLYNSG